jgi:putative glutamine amidotransferase
MSDSEPRRRPVIGICAVQERARWSFWDQEAALVASTYLTAVRRGGGLPLPLVPEALTPSDLECLAGRIDGLLLIGGADVDPACYGQEPTPRTEATFPARDEFELALAGAALALDLPVLGICRGLQILNVATGGTLHQHLADVGFDQHRPAPGFLDQRTFHTVVVEPGSSLADLTGSGPLAVNSHHHQGIDTVGEGGRVVARSQLDGLVEAVEWPRRRFAVGVQWHPEALEIDATIAALVDAANGRVGAVESLERAS